VPAKYSFAIRRGFLSLTPEAQETLCEPLQGRCKACYVTGLLLVLIAPVVLGYTIVFSFGHFVPCSPLLMRLAVVAVALLAIFVGPYLALKATDPIRNRYFKRCLDSVALKRFVSQHPSQHD